MIKTEPTVIKQIFRTEANGFSRISARVDGTPVWFESGDVEMQPRGEIFASAFLLPAMKRRADLRIEGLSLSPLWLTNTKQLMERFSAWWGYTPVKISSDTTWRPSDNKPSDAHTGLFFTAGVDSFYTLLHSGEEIRDLIYVHGFDSAVSDHIRLEDARKHLSQIAAETGRRLIILKTNLREHPLIRDMGWEKSHGAALVSAAYALPDIQRMLISSSYPVGFLIPYGSHPETDPLWSGDQLTFVHYGQHARRLDKLTAIADHPLVRHHLRICFKNPGQPSNCCRCEKCLRNMLFLESMGKLASFEAFPSRSHLIWRAFGVSSIPANYFAVYHDLIKSAPHWRPKLIMRIMLARSWFRNTKRDLINKLLGKKSN
jgi:hypothetical protein